MDRSSARNFLLVGLLVSAAACSTPHPVVQSLASDTAQDASAQSASPEPKRLPDDVIPSYLTDGVPHRTRYINYGYGYSVLIPKGLVAYSSTPPAPNHGIGIALSYKPASYLYVDGSYNALFWESLDEAVSVRLKWLREDHPDAQLLKKEPAQLAGLPALRLGAKYDRQGVNRIEETIVAFREVEGEIGMVYTVSVDTTETRYSEDIITLNNIVDGWKLRKPE